MTNNHLVELAGRCEAMPANADRSMHDELSRAIHDALPDGVRPVNGACRDYARSIDAAMTLVPEGWTDVRIGYHRMTDGSVRAHAEIEFDVSDMSLTNEGRAATPALALTAAALRARSRATQPERDGNYILDSLNGIG